MGPLLDEPGEQLFHFVRELSRPASAPLRDPARPTRDEVDLSRGWQVAQATRPVARPRGRTPAEYLHTGNRPPGWMAAAPSCSRSTPRSRPANSAWRQPRTGCTFAAARQTPCCRESTGSRTAWRSGRPVSLRRQQHAPRCVGPALSVFLFFAVRRSAARNRDRPAARWIPGETCARGRQRRVDTGGAEYAGAVEALPGVRRGQ